MTIVATDGSCLDNPGGASAWAWVSDSGASASGFLGAGTNQTAELHGILQALKAHKNEVNLVIESDSTYAINCATVWIGSWQKNNWRTKKGSPVKNRAIIEQIAIELGRRSTPPQFVKVKGHAAVGTHPRNEQADRLAKSTAKAGNSTG